MAYQRLMKKVAPVVLSAAVAMTSMPATAFAADFSDTEVTVAEESADIEEASAEAADTDCKFGGSGPDRQHHFRL